jgi:colanic acid/amylovoran biosynthesis glycosyltransferase
MTPTVVIYRDYLLDRSETFIRSQAAALTDFHVAFAGSRRIDGLDLAPSPVYTVNGGGVLGHARELRFKLFGNAPTLVKQLRAVKPILVHAHFGSDGFRALRLAQQLNIPLIVTFHGSDATMVDATDRDAYYGHRRYLANKRQLQDGASLCIAVSGFIARQLVEQQFPPEKVIVHYIGVDTELFKPRLGETGLTVVFVGRLVEVKGLRYLIAAMAEVQREWPAAELVVIGDGPLRQDLEREARHNLRHYRFLGYQDQRSVCDWIDQAAVFCVPSVTAPSGAKEGFGIVFAEAQSLAKPVVSFASGGIPEAVKHGETGLLAPEGDWRQLARYLSLLIGDQQLRGKFGTAGRRMVQQLFDIRRQSRKLEGIYKTIGYSM